MGEGENGSQAESAEPPTLAVAPKKRPWLQFHLSTAVALMLVAGGFLWANLTPTVGVEEISVVYGVADAKAGSGYTLSATIRRRGWPWAVVSQLLETKQSPDGLADLQAADRIIWTLPNWPFPVGTEWQAVVLDAIVAVCTLVAVGLILEWRIRRQSAKAEPPKDGTT